MFACNIIILCLSDYVFSFDLLCIKMPAGRLMLFKGCIQFKALQTNVYVSESSKFLHLYIEKRPFPKACFSLGPLQFFCVFFLSEGRFVLHVSSLCLIEIIIAAKYFLLMQWRLLQNFSLLSIPLVLS